jgi:Arc/MetJ family transcription regulator
LRSSDDNILAVLSGRKLVSDVAASVVRQSVTDMLMANNIKVNGASVNYFVKGLTQRAAVKANAGVTRYFNLATLEAVVLKARNRTVDQRKAAEEERLRQQANKAVIGAFEKIGFSSNNMDPAYLAEITAQVLNESNRTHEDHIYAQSVVVKKVECDLR